MGWKRYSVAIPRKYNLLHLPFFFGQYFDLSSSGSTSILMAVWLLPGLHLYLSYLPTALRHNSLNLGSEESKTVFLSCYPTNLRQIISRFWSSPPTWTKLRMKLPPNVIVPSNWYLPSQPTLLLFHLAPCRPETSLPHALALGDGPFSSLSRPWGKKKTTKSSLK